VVFSKESQLSSERISNFQTQIAFDFSKRKQRTSEKLFNQTRDESRVDDFS